MIEEIVAAPRRIHRWLWISGSIVIALILTWLVPRIILHYQIGQELKALRADGCPTTLSELEAMYPKPLGPNAADTFAAAFDQFNPANGRGVPLMSDASLPEVGKPLPADVKSKIDRFLADNAKTLELLHSAVAIKDARWPVPLDYGPLPPLSHLGPLEQSARLLELEALSRAEDDRPDEAADAIVAMFGLARSLSQEPNGVSQSFRVDIHVATSQALERVLGRCTVPDERLQQLFSLTESDDTPQCFERALCASICQWNNCFETGDLLGKYQSPRGLEYSIRALVYRLGNQALRDQLMLLQHGRSSLKACRTFSVAMIREVNTERRAVWEREKATEAALERQNAKSAASRIWRRFVAPEISPRATRMRYLSFLVETERGWVPYPGQFSDTAVLRVMRTGLTVERFRLARDRFPNRLEELMPEFMKDILSDPFDDKPLRYKFDAQGCVIYSISRNLRDDGGIYRPADEGSPPDDIALHLVTRGK